MIRKSGFIASALAAAVMMVAPTGSAVAFPAMPQIVQKHVSSSDVTPVQNRSIDAMREARRNQWRMHRGHGYYGRYRGSRHYRPGWRRHNGWWFPPAAFALGLALGAAPRYAEPPRRYRDLPRAHYRWCDRNYRTYRASDNTFIPRRGVRAECRSPYWP
ncbi:MAG: BA14K family protein [Zhengella sp.]|uniref:BA14K family protein n=1 Tax=Zhengella sp. TaxID=2282762 RepID=UPI003526F42E